MDAGDSVNKIGSDSFGIFNDSISTGGQLDGREFTIVHLGGDHYDFGSAGRVQEQAEISMQESRGAQGARSSTLPVRQTGIGKIEKKLNLKK